MRRIWFKQQFVDDILSGVKRDTIRQLTKLPAVGDVVAFSVGPRLPFAYARITDVQVARNVSPERRARLFEIYGPISPHDLVRISFQLVPKPKEITS